jgi:ankyrin repeat protein
MDVGQFNIKCTTSKQSNQIKNKLHHAIKANDFNKVVELVEENDVDANEEISVEGNFWTCLHYAAHFNGDQILEYFLNRTYQRNLDQFAEIVNTQTKEGWSPLMVATIYQALECIKVFIKYGGIKTDLVDNEGKTPLELAEYYGAIYCYEVLMNLPWGVLDINELYLKQEKVLNFENDQQYYNLLMHGIPRPCAYCESNLGYLRYSECCGTPMHKQCLAERDFICAGCGNGNSNVYGEILDPTKAFMFNGS